MALSRYTLPLFITSNKLVLEELLDDSRKENPILWCEKSNFSNAYGGGGCFMGRQGMRGGMEQQ